VEQFLTHLAVDGHISASTQNQALNALVFLYRQVLEIDLGRFDAVRARRPKRLPVVLAPEEVAAVLQRVQGCDGVFQIRSTCSTTLLRRMCARQSSRPLRQCRSIDGLSSYSLPEACMVRNG